jgi:LPXTG-site transpeptidase (sortase) family protein
LASTIDVHDRCCAYGVYDQKETNIIKILKSGLLAIIVIGCGLFVLETRHPSSEIADFGLVQTANPADPVLIKIPSLGVVAAIKKVGMTPDGFMDVPKLPFDTAWYGLGPRPGEIGSAVIDGHVDWKNGSSAIFTNLHLLKPGDKVVVQDIAGAVTTFTVRLSRTYDPRAYAPEVFTSDDGRAHLNLITCEGVWDNVAQGYSQRLVVFTDKE